MIGLEEYVSEALTPCIYEAHAHQVYTQVQALNFIGNRIKQQIKRYESYNKKTKVQEARDLLTKILLAHVPVVEGNLKMKAVYTAVMLRRTILAKLGKIKVDDRGI